MSDDQFQILLKKLSALHYQGIATGIAAAITIGLLLGSTHFISRLYH
jgi:hypothetical protein